MLLSYPLTLCMLCDLSLAGYAAVLPRIQRRRTSEKLAVATLPRTSFSAGPTLSDLLDWFLSWLLRFWRREQDRFDPESGEAVPVRPV